MSHPYSAPTAVPLFLKPGFVERTAARRISYPEALRFAAIHEDVYTEDGFTLIDVPAAPVADRVALIERVVRSSDAHGAGG